MVLRVGVAAVSCLLVLVGGTRPADVEIVTSDHGHLVQVGGHAAGKISHRHAEVEDRAESKAASEQGRHAARASSLGVLNVSASRIHHHSHGAAESHGTLSGVTGSAKVGGDKKPADDDKKPADDDKPATAEEEQVKKLEKEESSAFKSGLESLASAVSDPKDFLLNQKEMQALQAGLRKAIDLSENKGKCLADGEFKGLGCAPGKADAAPICSCASMLDHCYIPEDPSETVKLFTSGNMKGAIDKAKVVVFGQCTLSWVMVAILVVVGLLIVGIGLLCLRSLLLKKRSPRASRET